MIVFNDSVKFSKLKLRFNLRNSFMKFASNTVAFSGVKDRLQCWSENVLSMIYKRKF